MVLYVNPLTPRVKPRVIQSVLTFDSMDQVCNFGRFLNFELGTIEVKRFMKLT